MTSRMGKGVLWIWTTIAMAAMAFAAVQEVQLPDGEGKKVLEEKCLQCHDMALITDKRATKEEWTDTIEMMKLSGAVLEDMETTVLIDYLAANLGPAGSTAAAAPAAGGLPEGDGKQIFEDACISCHGADFVTEAKNDRDQWTDVVNQMKLIGAPVADNQVSVLVDYLTRNFGPRE